MLRRLRGSGGLPYYPESYRTYPETNDRPCGRRARGRSQTHSQPDAGKLSGKTKQRNDPRGSDTVPRTACGGTWQPNGMA